jgi:hypothetical protein
MTYNPGDTLKLIDNHAMCARKNARCIVTHCDEYMVYVSWLNETTRNGQKDGGYDIERFEIIYKKV